MGNNQTIKACGDSLFIGNVVLTVFGPVSAKGGENALETMQSQNRDLSTTQAAFTSLRQLCIDSKYQFEVISQSTI